MIDHTRHSGIFDASKTEVTLVGAGGIGAVTAVTLAKMGIGKLTVYDDDVVDKVNIATQFHKISDIGKVKAWAVCDAVSAYADTFCSGYGIRIDKNWIFDDKDIYISTVDSIASRQEIWQALLDSNMYDQWHSFYVDARMGAEVFEMFVVRMGEHEWYEHHLMSSSDNDFPDLPCTSKATIYTANIAAGHIGAAVRRIITNQQEPGLLTHHIFHNKLSFLSM